MDYGIGFTGQEQKNRGFLETSRVFLFVYLFLLLLLLSLSREIIVSKKSPQNDLEKGLV